MVSQLDTIEWTLCTTCEASSECIHELSCLNDSPYIVMSSIFIRTTAGPWQMALAPAAVPAASTSTRLCCPETGAQASVTEKSVWLLDAQCMKLINVYMLALFLSPTQLRPD